MTIYIDSNYMCHREYQEGYTEASHDYFDTICPLSIECYKFIPDRDFIQCVDSKTADAYQKQYDELHPEMVDMQESLNMLGVE